MSVLLADTLCRIKNGYVKKHLHTFVKNSKFICSVLYLLYKLGYIVSFSIIDKTRVDVFLKYNQGVPGCRGYKMISVSGKRLYVSYTTLKKYQTRNLIQRAGFLILSTNQGLMTDQEALSRRIGGELLFYIY